ncbi:mechanosensitive ion channel domain-containing protein [Altererythrobacter sp. H2]|uniref:mechanosensitive ion channel family protein n=1 Tax=Altererythrobacter sp. H2 TaxID=3108391 RepID=UPI002B4BDE2E|nr:mechanosensitive ion channel domain-containing protein [Altererythrobacter sp. H2]WRK96978.1 mechanosensitive ion channel domain-containing protein [Altererythrobacter sp. H2]
MTLPTAPTATPAPSPEPTETAASVTPPVPEPVESEAVTPTADGIKEAVTERSQAVGGVVDTLDAWALSIGEMRVSLWDAMVLLMVIGTIIVAAWFVSKLAHSGLRRMNRLDPSQHVLADKLVTLAVWALAILIGIDVLGIDLTALAVFSGAFGLAIGFGLQKTFGNLIAGIILLLDKSIKPGDVIAVSDQAGNSTFGEIRKIGIRAVSITTRDQKEYLIPNENLMVNQVENWSYSSKNVRMQVPVGIGYNCDIKLAEKLMLEAAKASKRVLASPPPTVWLDQYGENSVDFVIHCWITDPEAGIGNIRSEVLKRLWDLFQENGIEIPFPQRDINLRNNAQFEQLIAAIAQRMDTRPDTDPDMGPGSKQS